MPQPAEIRQWLGDGQTGVLCWGDEWGSVAFRLERDNPFLSSIHCHPAEVRRFLSEHPCSLVITKDDLHVARLRTVVPAGRTIQQVAEHPRMRLFLVSPIAAQTGAVQ
jgi:hypothetical protein